MTFARRRSNEGGAAIVEMIMVLPMFLFVMLAIVELSRAWYTLHITTTAVREGARVASVATNTTYSNVATARVNAILAAAGITPSGAPSVSLQNITGCGSPCDQEVVVTASSTFNTIFPLLSSLLSNLNITQTAKMRFEGG